MTFILSGAAVSQTVTPTPLPDPYWVAFSSDAAKLIGLTTTPNQWPTDSAWLQVLAGNGLLVEGANFSNPIATAYSGHQFGMWAGQLGDGRAILLGDIQGQEIQLKGAGKTPYSRMGDGRAVLRSSIREYLCSEAMHALGIPTTRALAVVGSKQKVIRETVETAAVCTRLAPSFLRVGHFEHFASLQMHAELQMLADDLISNFYPTCGDSTAPYLELFKAISARTAHLAAQWQAVGFCHGVLNTDNTSLLGLTMDYGPYGFLDQFQINHICNHSDSGGRYSYQRQPQILHWNMACLASAMLPLIEQELKQANVSMSENDLSNTAQTALRSALALYPEIYQTAWEAHFRAKLGLLEPQSDDVTLIESLLQLMHHNQIDFTTFFRHLANLSTLPSSNQNKVLRDQFLNRDGFDAWLLRYRTRLQQEHSNDQARKQRMNLVNPKFILRNHLAQAAIEAAQADDFSELSRLATILRTPFDEQLEYDAYAQPPPPELNSIEVSCSS